MEIEIGILAPPQMQYAKELQKVAVDQFTQRGKFAMKKNFGRQCAKS